WAPDLVARILIVEDDPIFAGIVAQRLERELYSVEVVDNGDDAAELLQVSDFDLIILDWELPGKSGIDVLRGYRNQGRVSPVLILTGRDTIIDKDVGFSAGSDDYLTKPFDPHELFLRVKALLRRTSPLRSDQLIVDNVRLDPQEFCLYVGDNLVDLQ